MEMEKNNVRCQDIQHKIAPAFCDIRRLQNDCVHAKNIGFSSVEEVYLESGNEV
jgi:hypothetical protein